MIAKRMPKSARGVLLVVLAGAGGVLGFQTPGAQAAQMVSGSDRSTVSSAETSAVEVTTKREGKATRFYVANRELCEVTMTFETALVNLQSDKAFPYTTTLPPGQTTEVFTLSPVRPEDKWHYAYTNYYKLGSACAEHDDTYAYQLPYTPGSEFKVTQGYNGSFSHKGANQYAIDWKMPEGTLVRAARGGVVVKVKDDSDTGGPNAAFDHCNNFVLIRHEDGTLGQYCHLQKKGGLVSAGQQVAAGDVIARSGGTGFSSGSHLHFCVYKNKDGRHRQSLPVKFRTATQNSVTLVEGRSYRAAEILQSASGKSKAKGG